MQKIFLSIILLICSLLSCSIYKSRKQTYSTHIAFKGGVLADKVWSDSLEFQRTSWFHDATVNYEVLVAELTSESPFAHWLKGDRLLLTSCKKFYIIALYADINAAHGTSLLVSEMEKSGFEEKSILDFSHQIKAHQNYKDWKLGRHKILGLCASKKGVTNITINIPGHPTRKLL